MVRLPCRQRLWRRLRQFQLATTVSALDANVGIAVVAVIAEAADACRAVAPLAPWSSGRPSSHPPIVRSSGQR